MAWGQVGKGRDDVETCDVIHEDAADEGDEKSHDSEEDELRQPTCLPITGPPMAPSDAPPQDAYEYLRQVQYERMRCPQTVEVEVEERAPRRQKKTRGGRRSNIPERLSCGEEDARHSPEWLVDAPAAFKLLRQRFASMRLAQRGEERGSVEGPPPLHTKVDTWRTRIAKGERPSAKLLPTQDFCSSNNLLTAAVDAFIAAHVKAEAEQGGDEEAQGDENENNESRNVAEARNCLDSDTFRTNTSEWMFAALSFAQEPIVEDISCEMQRLRRTCLQLIAAGRERGEPNSSYAPAALLHTIVTEVFGQH